MFSCQFTQYISICTVITGPSNGYTVVYSRSSPYLVMITHRDGADTSGVDDGGDVVCDSGGVGSGGRVCWC